jgi:hypothetical protein
MPVFIMDDPGAQTQQELAEIITALTELTGLPSRWSRRVELVPDAEFKGKKRFLCDIQIDAALAGQPERWTTLIHEALHSISAGYVRDDYQDFHGWEEGVVEQMQRFLRPRVLSRLGIGVSPDVFHRLDAEHGYNKFIQALETLRGASHVPTQRAEAFYLDLLATPLRERQGRVARYGFTLPASQRADFFAVMSAANVVLRARRG